MTSLRTPAAWRELLAGIRPVPASDTPRRTEIDATEERVLAVLVEHGLDAFQGRLVLVGRAARLARWDRWAVGELDELAVDVAWMALPAEPAVRWYLVNADQAVRDDGLEAEVWAMRDTLFGSEHDPGVDPAPRWEQEALMDCGLRPETVPRYTKKLGDRLAERPAPCSVWWLGV